MTTRRTNHEAAMRILTLTALVLSAAGCSAEEPTPEPQNVVRVSSLTEGTVLEPGRYELPFEGAATDSPVAQVDVPEGFQVWNGSVLWNSDDSKATGGLMFWKVDEVAHDPCRADATGRSFYDPGPSVQDLATALMQQRYRKGPNPVPTTLAGHDGLYLELRFTKQLDLAQCEHADLDAWRSDGSNDYRYQYNTDSIDRIWILDVDGERLLVNETHSHDQSPNGDPILDDMVTSVSIEAGH